MRLKLKPIAIAIVIMSLLSSISCFAQIDEPPAEFWYNGKSYNSLIVNRIPDYGDGHRDGCVVLTDLVLELKDKDSLSVEGIVKDIKNRAPLPAATVSVYRKNGSIDTYGTNAYGHFVISKSSSPVKSILAQSLGYRRLEIQIKRKWLF